MRSLLIAVLALLLSAPPQAARAADTEPQVYFFWSASCPFSRNARSFLQKTKSADAQLRIREFEVDQSLANALLLEKVYDRIGLTGFTMVPLVVVGHHVIIGYIDDDSTGKEILADIVECRKAGCRDTIRDLIDGPGLEQAAVASLAKPIACESSTVVKPGRPLHLNR